MSFKSTLVFAGLLLMPNLLAKPRVLNFESKHVANEMILTFQSEVSSEQKIEIVQSYGAEIVESFKSSNSVLVRFPEEQNLIRSMGVSLASNPNIESAGLNRIFKLNMAANDPKASKQYQHPLMGSEKAWDITTGLKDVTVAIIDTGMIYDHPDLKDNVWTNPGESGLDAKGKDKKTNGFDDDSNGYVDDFRGWDFAENDNDPLDDHGHGTHCAGSIGAIGNNGVGITGVNWNVSLIPLRFISSSGEGTEANAIKAVEYATMMKFNLTSNSWGGDPEASDGPDALYAAIAAAGKAGQLFVAAAGNDGRNTDTKPTYPASYDLDNIISVAASDSSDRMASFSNYGINTVDIMAPGMNVYSTTKKSLFGGEYGAMSGTSMAAPIVAGAAALVLSKYPNAAALEIKEMLLKSADQIAAGKGKVKAGGRLNIYKALTQ